MHPLQLVVNCQQLLADVICVGKIRQRLQNIFQGSLCIDQQTAIGAAWLNSHGHNIVFSPFSDMPPRTGVCTATDLKSLSRNSRFAVVGGFHHIPRTLHTSWRGPDAASSRLSLGLNAVLVEVITAAQESIPGEHRTATDQFGTQVLPVDHEPTHKTAVNVPRSELEVAHIPRTNQLLNDTNARVDQGRCWLRGACRQARRRVLP